MNSLSVYTSGMYGSLDTSFGENRSLYMAEVAGRNNRYPRNGVSYQQPNFRSLTPKASGVTVHTRLLVRGQPGLTRQKVGRNIGFENHVDIRTLVLRPPARPVGYVFFQLNTLRYSPDKEVGAVHVKYVLARSARKDQRLDAGGV
jgi:hypothetical protein